MVSIQTRSIGDILQETLRLYVRDWPVYLGVGAAIQVPFGLAFSVWLLSSGFHVRIESLEAIATIDPALLNDTAWRLAAVFLVASANLLLTVSAVYGAVVYAVHERCSGSIPTFRSAMFFGWRAFLAQALTSPNWLLPG